ncbi:3'-5' exonuclease [Tulasnella sp. 427]|nr:3'-5' exonuclease [Tulasnella sp. 427]
MAEGSSARFKATRKHSGRRSSSSGGLGVKLSSNWLSLQKELGSGRSNTNDGPVKQQSAQRPRARKSTPRGTPAQADPPVAPEPAPMTSNSVIANMIKALNGARLNTNAYADAGPSNSSFELASKSSDVKHLRKMILGKLRYTEAEETIGTYIAIDCEMVQVGDAREFSLARISIVNFFGHVVLDTYVKQTKPVTEYLTAISGIRPSDLKGPNARSFDEVQGVVQELFKGQTIIGHSIHHDLEALKITHPATHIRDTQLMTGKHPKLKTLVKQRLGINIQVGEHDSVTDARAAMALFRLHKSELDLIKLHETEGWGGVTSTSEDPKPAIDPPATQPAAAGKIDIKDSPPTNRNAEPVPAQPLNARRLSKSALRAVKKERVKASGEVRDLKLSRSLQIKVKTKPGPDGSAPKKASKRSLDKTERPSRRPEHAEERRARRTGEKWWSTL